MKQYTLEEIATYPGYKIISVWGSAYSIPEVGKVYIPQGISTYRHYYLLFHELGHIALFQLGQTSNDDNEETICSMVAYRLLARADKASGHELDTSENHHLQARADQAVAHILGESKSGLCITCPHLLVV